MRGHKRVHKGVHARLRRAMDARERALAPRIHLLRKTFLRRWMDCTATRACPSCASLSAASRVNPTCGVKPGNDGVVVTERLWEVGDIVNVLEAWEAAKLGVPIWEESHGMVQAENIGRRRSN